MVNRRVPKFSSHNCAQISKKMLMCPKFRTNPVLKYTKCHISTNLSSFQKLCVLYCQKLLAFAPTNQRFTEKNWRSGNTVCDPCLGHDPYCKNHSHRRRSRSEASAAGNFSHFFFSAAGITESGII